MRRSGQGVTARNCRRLVCWFYFLIPPVNSLFHIRMEESAAPGVFVYKTPPKTQRYSMKLHFFSSLILVCVQEQTVCLSFISLRRDAAILLFEGKKNNLAEMLCDVKERRFLLQLRKITMIPKYLRRSHCGLFCRSCFRRHVNCAVIEIGSRDEECYIFLPCS